jgi:hypothetical protein
MFPRALCLALAVGLTLPPLASADAQIVGASYASSGTGAMAFANQQSTTGSSSLRVVGADGQITPAQTIVDGFNDPQVAMGPRGDVIVAWVNREGVFARFQPAGGTLGPVETVSTEADFLQDLIPLAVDGAGNAYVAYTTEPVSSRLRVRVRTVAGVWEPEQILGGTRVSGPELRVSANGTALLAWHQHGGKALNGTRVALSTRAPGQRFTPPAIIAGTPRNASSPTVALNDRGDAVVVWLERHRTGPRRTVDFSVHGRFRAAGSGFGKARRLSHISAAGPSVAVAPDGRMTLAWADWSNRRVEARVRSTTGVLGRPHILTRDLGVNSWITALASGAGAVGWIDRDPGTVLVRVAHATGDRRFRPPQLITRLRGYDLDPVWTATPTTLTVVPNPPARPEDPIPWLSVPLPAR